MWRQVHPYHDGYIWNVHLTQIHGLWGHHQGYFALSSNYNTNRAWLYTWLLGMCTGETNITLPRHVWTCSFKPLLKRSESTYHYIIFLFEIMIGRLTTKLKLKTLHPSHHRKQNSYSLFCLLSSTNVMSCNELPSVRHISYQHWLFAKETPVPFWTSSCLPSLLL